MHHTLMDGLDQGFVTPAHLHFVRNHGAVPCVDELALRTWTIRVHGLVENAATFTLHDLKTKFRTVTLPVTLVCAGNRRKEQNMVRKSLGTDLRCRSRWATPDLHAGFNWGAAGGWSSFATPGRQIL